MNPYGKHLPIFPTFHDTPTEDQIERTVERLFDRADAALMSNRATQSQYDAWGAALNGWAEDQYCAA